jgi:predicted permease
MGQLISDVRSGVRMLVKYPTLSVVAVLTLGLGIGLSTTVFCVVNGGLYKGLPFPDAGRVVEVVPVKAGQSNDNGNLNPISVQDIAVFQQRQTSFEHIGAFFLTPVNLSTDDGRPERFNGGLLTVEAFEAIGVQPIMGRGFREGDDKSGAPPVMLIGYSLWRDRFAGASDIVGKSVRANGVYRSVIGVMPGKFGFPILQNVWLPLTADPLASKRGEGPVYLLIGRLKQDVSLSQARAQVVTIAGQIASEFPTTNKGTSADVIPYAQTVLGKQIYALLYTMLAAGIGVLLIACVNVSNLLVARASLRRREVAVRLALGAGRARVVQQHLTEVLVLAFLGAGVGVVMSVFGSRWFTRAISVNPPPFWMSFDLDTHVMWFVLGLIVVASLFAGMMPSLHAARVDVGAMLKDDSRGSTSAKLGRFSNGLVIAELAVSCGLLIAAGLMVKSVVQLKNVQMPFGVEHVLTARVDLPPATYPNSPASIRFFEQLLPKLQAVPGIEAATLSDGLPAAGNGALPVHVEGKTYQADNSDAPLAREGIVTLGYFDTFETKILEGRDFNTGDNATSVPVAIINASFARQLYPGVDPIGRQMKRYPRSGHPEPWMTIVGVVPDLIMEGIGNNNASPVGYYIPISQSDVANSVRIALRTRGEPASMVALTRAAVVSLDHDLALYDVDSMRTVIDRQTWFYTVFGTFFMAFGFCALFLAAAGLYGVMSFAVTQRTREMGVRLALGAQGRELIMLIMRKSVVQLGIGLVFGIGLGLLMSAQLQFVIYHVNPRDVTVFSLVVVTLAVSSLVASFLPARRVTKIDPVVALVAE